MDKQQAFHEIENSNNEIPFEAIEFLYNHPADKEILEKVRYFIANAYNDDEMYDDVYDEYSSAPLWYAIVAEKQHDEALIDEIINLYIDEDNDTWDFLNEQGSYLVSLLSEKYKSVPNKVFGAIEEFIFEDSDAPYLYLFDAINYIDVEQAKEKILTILKDGYFTWYAPFVVKAASLQIKEIIPILNKFINELKNEKKDFATQLLIGDCEEAIKIINGEEKPSKPYYETRGHWKKHYEGFIDVFEEHEKKVVTPQPVSEITSTKKTGRNSPCPCGSGKKFKHCCINKGIYD